MTYKNRLNPYRRKLWAARFFKTRTLAKSAIENGKVLIDGQKCKPSRTIGGNETLSIRRSDEVIEVVVVMLSEQRRGAPEAQKLYQETSESIARREQLTAKRKALRDSMPISVRPNKKQRRQIHKFLDN
ncbi:S4 domain-containing protein [Porticoccaceae bacterium]|nr:S4 domain-containing protein [Porticoccaceae bacterium]MDA8681751.1 S4 domain-containing protein [Porticoccaceae bacterium]MDB2344109.1 S4 domain-containing protein [Porticoccaceae bacterium]MDB2486708.1 S4 domain-containing protein [Porticoccaceae bacterium]MDB2634823.1 S4 domain-containing protein [Porticoccaceae bacterium]